MTIDLPATKALADRLAGDVMNQLERDGCANRNNLAETLLAGLVLDAAQRPDIIQEFLPEIEKSAKPCEHHSTAAEYQARRVDNAKDLSGGFEITTLDRGALQIWYRSDIRRIWARDELDALFTALHDLGKDGEHYCIPLTYLDLVLLRSGELITGLEATQRGVKADG